MVIVMVIVMVMMMMILSKSFSVPKVRFWETKKYEGNIDLRTNYKRKVSDGNILVLGSGTPKNMKGKSITFQIVKENEVMEIYRNSEPKVIPHQGGLPPSLLEI